MAEFSTAPGILIAMNELMDPNFFRSVVVMVEHNEEGALGLVLNHQTEYLCRTVVDSFDLEWPSVEEMHLLRGGPVESQSLWMLHDDGWRFSETMRLAGGISVSRSREALSRLCAADENRIRFIVGYAGWGPGQLEQEIAEGAWLTGALHPELVFDYPAEDVWTKAIRSLGVDPAHLVGANSTVQ